MIIKDSNTLINSLIRYAREKLSLHVADETYLTNLLLAKLHCVDYQYHREPVNNIDDLITSIEQLAITKKLATAETIDSFTIAIMGMISPLPSLVNERFFKLLKDFSPDKACKYLFALQVDNNYIKQSRIKLNLFWKASFPGNHLEITINLSKPEKDNKLTAKLAQEAAVNYPKCILCYENLGYAGRINSPARQNIRLIDFKLANEDWFMQFSPYQYYEEHVVVINKSHTNMKIDQETFEKLCDFVDLFPNYFVGSNASLPIVGGSILNHEHFQGGKHIMPIFSAPMKYSFNKKGYDDCQISYLDWYNSCLKIVSPNRESIIKIASEILAIWTIYEDKQIDLIPYSTAQHNAITPIIQKIDNCYHLYIILRNNRTSEEHPDGIFHAHQQFHNIKKESIGLIEASGLFILPGRLKRQFTLVSEILTGTISLEAALDKHPDLSVHQAMIMQLQKEYPSLKSRQSAEEIIEKYINETCKQILECTAIFKNNAIGENHLLQFLNKVGLEKIGG